MPLLIKTKGGGVIKVDDEEGKTTALVVSTTNKNGNSIVPQNTDKTLQVLSSIPKPTKIPLTIQQPITSLTVRNEKVQDDYPTALIAEYVNDYNISYAHIIVTHNLLNEKRQMVPKITTRIDLEELKIKAPQSVREREKSLNLIAKLKLQLQDIEKDQKINDYNNEALPIIKEYEKIGPFISRKVFGSTEVIADPDAVIRLDLVERYIEVAKRYIKVDIKFKIKNEIFCKCGESLNNVFIDSNGAQKCPACNHQQFIPQLSANLNDNIAGNSKSKNEYDNWDNLYKAFLRFQGKQINKISPKTLEALDKYFRIKDLPNSTNIDEIKYDNKGRKKGTSLQMMITALRETQNVVYYEDAHLICKLVWKWELPELSHLESKLQSDYSKTQAVFNSMNKDRTSSLGTQYRLYKHLQLIGVDCNQQDFKMPTMRNVIEAHDDMWRIMCQKTDDPSIYFIPTI